MQALTHSITKTRLLQTWLGNQTYLDPKDEGVRSPDAVAIDDELVQAFGRLDLQTMAYVDPRPVI